VESELLLSRQMVSWIHIGDLHMTEAGEQNDLDLQAIVREINERFADSVSFVYLPGDVAERGNREAYRVVRRSLDRLKLPWHAIIGDHDVHEKSFDNFLESMGTATHYAFTAGDVRFLALNAFDVPDPRSFTVLPEQMGWIEEQLREAAVFHQTSVLFVHCYPSDLKTGHVELAELIRKYDVRLVDMGHTHYNEIANDGRTLYTATRSTGQIEEGPVGFSVTNIDEGVISWRFFEIGQDPAVTITSPGDERLLRASDGGAQGDLRVRARVWSRGEIEHVEASLDGFRTELGRTAHSNVWEGVVPATAIPHGIHQLRVTARDAEGREASDTISASVGEVPVFAPKRQERDQDNAIPAWPEHGILGTQLGPNKNGKKW
jgi:3',5'-cyclic AMP phosphodiesterase CpdA